MCKAKGTSFLDVITELWNINPTITLFLFGVVSFPSFFQPDIGICYNLEPKAIPTHAFYWLLCESALQVHHEVRQIWVRILALPLSYNGVTFSSLPVPLHVHTLGENRILASQMAVGIKITYSFIQQTLTEHMTVLRSCLHTEYLVSSGTTILCILLRERGNK